MDVNKYFQSSSKLSKKNSERKYHQNLIFGLVCSLH